MDCVQRVGPITLAQFTKSAGDCWNGLFSDVLVKVIIYISMNTIHQNSTHKHNLKAHLHIQAFQFERDFKNVLNFLVQNKKMNVIF